MPYVTKFITFEGIEGSGKSTQISMTSTWLKQNGISHCVTREPGGTRAGEAIRQLLLHQKEIPLSPLTETSLFTAARHELIQEVILPSLKSGQWVLCDRFVDSTIAYQGYGRGVGEGTVRSFHSMIGNLMPDLTFYLDLPVDEGLSRLGTEMKDRFESLDYSFHRRVRDAYLLLNEKESRRFILLDAGQPADAIQSIIQDNLNRL